MKTKTITASEKDIKRLERSVKSSLVDEILTSSMMGSGCSVICPGWSVDEDARIYFCIDCCKFGEDRDAALAVARTGISVVYLQSTGGYYIGENPRIWAD